MRNTSAIAILILCSTAHGYFFRGKIGKTKTLENENESRDSAIAQEQGESSPAFGTSLFSELCADFPDTNVLFSPLSVYQALVLVKDGATIGSKNDLELEDILGPQEVRDQSNSLQKQSEGSDSFSGVKLSMATSIWANKLRKSYIYRAMETQSAEALPLPDTYADVDDWIADKTDGMITGLMGDGKLDPLSVALLVNAVHFKGVWTHKFDKKETADGTFTLSDKKTQVNARYMITQRDMEVIESSHSLGNAKVVVLDYGKNAAKPAEFTSMFILPAFPGIGSMKKVISGLDSGPISQLLDDARMTKVRLKLPRFQMEFGPAKLKHSLERMGMTIAFKKSARRKFNRMSSDPLLYVDDIHHGSCIEVSEEGTKAAAATVIVVRTRSAVLRISFLIGHLLLLCYTGQRGFLSLLEKLKILFSSFSLLKRHRDAIST